MNSRRKYVTEPGDREWVHASAWIAAAGGLIVVLLIAAMALLDPGRPAADTGRSPMPSAAAAAPSSAVAPNTPVHALPPIAPDAESYATPGSQPPSF